MREIFEKILSSFLPRGEFMKKGPASLAEIREVLKEFYRSDNYQPQIFDYLDCCHQSGSPNADKRDLDSAVLLFKEVNNQIKFPFKIPDLVTLNELLDTRVQ